ncbi:hypothetical protein GYMLUDRAFT_48749 [Collybiopsis luxurians FD-317 M1]|uniref:Unplaced genomic scaffold GYMLUscaffold_68, whole genome shotgun sequence n=1 Tax=Collybiopsis luxurians FD-317 M1 TaxID=944289 RepID=A0A0D0BHX9_9AGAR|nr:hypothetical protein GYMLUDRAFT_48749 [Collybiopsis luxurians FD-317 M1]
MSRRKEGRFIAQHGPRSECQFPEVIPVLTLSPLPLGLLQKEKTSSQLTQGIAAVDFPALTAADYL